MTLTDLSMRTILANLIDTGNLFDPAACYVGLAADIDVQNRPSNTAQSNVTAATGDVATRVAITAWSEPYKLGDGRWAADGPLCRFSPADSTESQVVQYWFLNSAATAGVLRAFEEFETPINLPNEFAEVVIIPRLTVDPAGNWSASVVYSAA